MRLSRHTRLLPYIEQAALFDRYDPSQTWSKNTAATGFTIPDYVPTIYVDNALANSSSPLAPDDHKADVAATAAPVANRGNTTASSGDGSVKLIAGDVSIRVFSSLVTRAGNEHLGDKLKY